MLRMSHLSPDHSGRLATKASQLVTQGAKFIDQHTTGGLRHGVIAAGEHVHSGISRFRPGMNGDVRFGQQRQAGDAMGQEAMADQLQQAGASS